MQPLKKKLLEMCLTMYSLPQNKNGNKSVPPVGLESVLSDPRRISIKEREEISVLCLPEFRVVTRILNKFSFVNEEILRS